METNLRQPCGTGLVSSWRPGPESPSCWHYPPHTRTVPDPRSTTNTTDTTERHIKILRFRHLFTITLATRQVIANSVQYNSLTPTTSARWCYDGTD